MWLNTIFHMDCIYSFEYTFSYIELKFKAVLTVALSTFYALVLVFCFS